MLSAAELLAAVDDPFSLEDIGLSSGPVVVAHLASGTPVNDIDAERLTPWLSAVRAVTVGVIDGPLAGAALDVAEGFDILLSEGEIGGHAVVATSDLAATIRELDEAATANPQAAVACAQLLRQQAFVDVGRGLVAESLTYSMLQGGPEFATWLAERGPATLPDDAEPAVLASRSGTALELTLNRPSRANAVHAPMRDLLVEHLRVAASDPTIDGLVLRGAGPSFCSGGDLAEFGTLPDPASAHATRLVRSPAWWLHQLARTTRAHLHGSCVGAGVELPAFAGTVLAHPDATFQLPEVAMGLVPGAGGTVSLPRRIGRQRTAHLAITGRTLDAGAALAWGIIDRIG